MSLWGGRRGSQNSRNSHSCVLKVTLGEAAVLLTGDIERAEEASLALRYQEQLRATVMVAPHHGSKTSSSYALLKRVDPAKLSLQPVTKIRSDTHTLKCSDGMKS